MKLMGIDPGTNNSAWVYFDTVANTVRGDFVDNPTLLISMRNLPTTPDAIVIESIEPQGQIVGRETLDTAMYSGRLFEAAHSRFGFTVRAYRLGRRHVVANLIAKRIKGKADAQIRQALIDRFGGDSKAIGGKKCKVCSGRGSKRKLGCALCASTGLETPPGPLHGLAGHLWSALAVAVTYADRPELAEAV